MGIQLPYILTITNRTGSFQFPENIEKETGYKAENFSKPGFFLERIHRNDKTRFVQFVESSENLSIESFKFRFKKNDENYIWILIRISDVKTIDENSKEITGTIDWNVERSYPKQLFEDIKTRNLFNISKDAIFILNANTYDLVDFNDNVQTLFACEDRDSIFESVLGFLDDDINDLSILNEMFKSAVENNESTGTFKLKKHTGDLFYAQVTFKSFNVDNIDYIMVLVTDISEKVEAEQLAEYRFNLQKLVYEISSKFINVASYEVDKEIVNSFKDVCGFMHADSIYIYQYRDLRREMELSQYWEKEAAEELADDLKIIPIQNNDIHYNTIHEKGVFKLNTKSAHKVIHSTTIQRINKNSDSVLLHIALTFQGNVIGFIGVSKKANAYVWSEDDIQLLQMLGEIYVLALQRKEAIKVLLEGERTYREIYNATTDAIMVVDSNNYSILDVNQAFTDIFGFAYSEYPEITLNAINSNDPGFTYDDFTKIIDNADDYVSIYEWYSKNKEGVLFWTEVSVKKAEIHGADCVLCIYRDISERKKSETIIRDSEDRFRNIVQQLSDIVFILNETGTINYVTPSIENVLGYSSNEIIGKSFRDFLSSNSIPVFDTFYQDLITKSEKSKLEEVQMQSITDNPIIVELYGNNMLDQHAINGVVITCRDITDRSQTEKKILDAVIRTEEHERERFAKNLHDDLGPLLSSLKMYVTMLSKLEEGEKRDFVYKQVEEILKEAIVTTKNVSNDLSPHVLTNYGLASAIDTFIKKVSNHIRINFENDISEVRFNTSIESSLYRISKELINNSLKHSDSSEINIKLKEKGAQLYLKYSDNGENFSEEKFQEYLKKGMGLSNIISRSKTLNSTYKFYTPKSGGFGFEMRVPLI